MKRNMTNRDKLSEEDYLLNLLQAGLDRVRRETEIKLNSNPKGLTYRGIRIIENKKLREGFIGFLSNDSMKYLDNVISAGTNV